MRKSLKLDEDQNRKSPSRNEYK
uniref:Uncharacterized protein n=1 Tax=Heterorhabditis bacteriophora TaxID=37862 RepID=A0A1I7WA33_HETBA